MAEHVTRRLEGRTALITGAGSGLGRATALRFASEGATVLCADRDGEAAEATAAGAREAGLTAGAAGAAGDAGAPGGAFALCFDVADLAAVEVAVADALAAHGPIDALFHAAGIVGEGSATTVTPETWERVIAVNLTGTWHVARAVLPGMVERRRGAIVLLASTAAIAGVPGIAAYAAAKGGVTALTRQMAVDYAADGVRVNAICPGTIPTPLVEQAWASRGRLGGDADAADVAAQVAQQYPLRRLGRPEDVAAMAAFLVSDEASWVTGVALPLEGGLTSAAWTPAA